jgi:cell division septation protein DedD
MAGGKGNRGGGDRVLESRHLVGFFLGVVLLCAVFFTLGYVMGHNQYGGSVQAYSSLTKRVFAPPATDSAPAKTKGGENPAAPNSGEWDFYGKNKSDNRINPAKPSTPAPAPSASAKNAPAAPPAPGKGGVAPARFQPPAMPKGAVTLQLAALTRESDALALADALQQKKFPSYVVTPTTDSLFRVQVGPYGDVKAAEAAKAALDREGFKAIIKR